VHYDTHRTVGATERYPSGAGLSFANQAFSLIQTLIQTVFATAGSISMQTGQMLHYRHLLNAVFGAAESESSASDRLASQNGASVRVTERSDRESEGFALQDGPGEAYNEAAFQYFLEIERKRSELSSRPFLLLLIDFTKHPRIDAVNADTLFSVLSLCLRETDFIGWYREGRIAGAVLTQHGDTDADDLSDVVRARIVGALRQRLPSDLARQLQTRIYQIPTHVKSPSQ
jgi:hypothetical protein